MARNVTWSLVLTVIVAGSGGMQPASADDSKKTPAVTYDDHVRPIFREHCFSCHNRDRAKGGLALDSYSAVIEGGSSGEVVLAEDPDSSRLWALVSHEEDPAMPPMQDKLAQAKLDVIKQWILGGLRENSGSKAIKRKSSPALAMVAGGGGKPEGPAAMPENVLRQPVVYSARPGAVSALAASPWAPLVAVGGHKQVVLYHTDTGECLGVLPFPEGVPYVLRFSRNGAVLLAGGGRGGHSGCVVLYDVRTGKRITKVGDELDAVLSADINDDLSKVALGGPQRIVRIYSTATGELLQEIRKHTDWVLAVRFSPDGVLLATADRSNGLFVWEADTAREYLDLRGHAGPIWEVSWRPDSNVLASAGQDGTVRLWEMNEGKEVKRFGAHGGGVCWVSYGQDGRLVTAGNDKTVKLWAGDGKALGTFPAFSEPALKTVLTYDGKRVIGGDWNGVVRVWDAATRKVITELAPNPPTLEMRLATATKAVQDATTAEDAARKAAEAAQAQSQQADTAKAQVAQNLAAKRAALAQSQKELAAAQARVQSLTAAIGKLKPQLDAATKNATAKQTLLKQAAGSLQTIEQQLAKLLQTQPKNDSERATREKQISEAFAKRSAAVRQRDELAAQVKGLTAELAKVRESYDANVKQLATAQAAIKTLTNNQKQLQAAVAALDESLKKATAEAAAKAKDAAAKLTAAKNAKQALATAQSSLAAATSELQRFRAMREQYVSNLDAAEKQVSELTTKQQSLAAQQKELAAKQAAAEKQLAELTAKLKQLQQQLAAVQQDKSNAAATLTKFAEQAKQLESALEEAQMKVELLREEQQTFNAAYGHYFEQPPAEASTKPAGEAASVAGK